MSDPGSVHAIFIEFITQLLRFLFGGECAEASAESIIIAAIPIYDIDENFSRALRGPLVLHGFYHREIIADVRQFSTLFFNFRKSL